MNATLYLQDFSIFFLNLKNCREVQWLDIRFLKPLAFSCFGRVYPSKNLCIGYSVSYSQNFEKPTCFP